MKVPKNSARNSRTAWFLVTNRARNGNGGFPISVWVSEDAVLERDGKGAKSNARLRVPLALVEQAADVERRRACERLRDAF